MRMRLSRTALATVFTLCAVGWSASCVTTPEPGDPEYPLNLEGSYEGSLSLGDSVYPVAAEIRTREDGTVRGSLRSTGPVDLNGDLSGSIRADSVVWRSAWTLPNSGCSGILLGWGAILPLGNGAEGLLRSEGSCPVANGAGSFHLYR